MSQFMDDLAELMPDTVVAQPTVSTFRGVRSVTGSPTSYVARVTGQQRLVKTSTGQEKVSTVMAVLAEAADVTIFHQFTLPTRFSPNAPPALSVEHESDEDGYSHTTVYF